jgi:2-polyprenyl-6-methoxyphenol hydroxylase-like FAD-dependent oxidoreductase
MLGCLRGKAVLIGDAAHPMRPTIGQGAALAMEDAITFAYRGATALSRRWPRMVALYGGAKAGSYFATPGTPRLEAVRNWALRLTPDPLFGAMAGLVSRWRPPDEPARQRPTRAGPAAVWKWL